MNVLFVCTGNTCRSPMAERIMRAQGGGKASLYVFSAGTSARLGDPMTPQAERALAGLGIAADGHMARRLDAEACSRADVILCMEKRHAELVKTMYPAASKAVFTLGSFAGEDKDVPDPYGGSDFEYAECARELSRLIEKALAKLFEE